MIALSQNTCPDNMSVPPKKNKKEIRAAQFITAAKELAEEKGMENLSVRQIAEQAGYHNSTIYTYFKDEALLLALSCVPSFADYSRELARLSASNPTNYDSFFSIWRHFCVSAFKKPDIFRIFFFGKYSRNLTELLTRYYELFPEEKAEYNQVISEMYYGNNFKERCFKILSPLIGDEKTRVTNENCAMLNSIISSVFRDLLDRKCSDPSLDNEKLTAWFLQCLHYLLDR